MLSMMARPKHRTIIGEFSIMYGAVLKGWLVGGVACATQESLWV